jgi:hypothetical protein
MIEKENLLPEILTTVVYSHTDFVDILKIQLEYIRDIDNKILLINESSLDISEITEKFSRVIRYNESLPYTSRLKCLSVLEDKVILFFHDIDILIYKDYLLLEELKKIMISKNIDRLDLQYNDDFDNNSNEQIFIDDGSDGFSLLHQTSGYVYNVNPSLWKLSALLEVVNAFPNATYRDIELVAQNYCATKLRFFKLNSKSYFNCGYFRCLYFFVFIHITHGGKFLPLDSSRLDSNIRDIYSEIFTKHNLKNSTRGFNQ